MPVGQALRHDPGNQSVSVDLELETLIVIGAVLDVAQKGFIVRSIALLLSLSLVAACNKSSSTDSAAASATGTTSTTSKTVATAATTASAAPTATGPVFKAKMMGFDMSKPLVETSLAPAGMVGLVIQAPEGAKVEKHVPGGGARVVAAGVNYSVAIREARFDPKSAKSSFAILDPKGNIATDTPDLVIFERSNGGSVLFNMGVSVDGKNYTCGSVATAASFTREVIDQTIESCRTLKKGG